MKAVQPRQPGRPGVGTAAIAKRQGRGAFGTRPLRLFSPLCLVAPGCASDARAAPDWRASVCAEHSVSAPPGERPRAKLTGSGADCGRWRRTPTRESSARATWTPCGSRSWRGPSFRCSPRSTYAAHVLPFGHSCAPAHSRPQALSAWTRSKATGRARKPTGKTMIQSVRQK